MCKNLIFVQKLVRITQRLKVRLTALIGVLSSFSWRKRARSMFCAVMEAVVGPIFKAILNLCKYKICLHVLFYMSYCTAQYSVYMPRKKNNVLTTMYKVQDNNCPTYYICTSYQVYVWWSKYTVMVTSSLKYIGGA